MTEDLYPKAKHLVLTEGKAAASYLQRRLQIGYNAAGDRRSWAHMQVFFAEIFGAK